MHSNSLRCRPCDKKVSDKKVSVTFLSARRRSRLGFEPSGARLPIIKHSTCMYLMPASRGATWTSSFAPMACRWTRKCGWFSRSGRTPRRMCFEFWLQRRSCWLPATLPVRLTCLPGLRKTLISTCAWPSRATPPVHLRFSLGWQMTRAMRFASLSPCGHTSRLKGLPGWHLTKADAKENGREACIREKSSLGTLPVHPRRFPCSRATQKAACETWSR